MLNAFQAPTLTSLHDKLTARLVHATEDRLDFVSSVDVQLHNTISYADSLEWEFDFKDLWLTPSRWTMMIRQYLEGEDVVEWIDKVTDKIGTSGRGIAVLRTKTVNARGGAATGHKNKETRRWGSCMLTLSYKAVPRPTITLHSRTSYLGYIAALDLTVAQVAARYLAEEMDIGVEDISFVWYNEALQFHGFKSLAYLLNHPDEDRRETYRGILLGDEAPDTPGLELAWKWMKKVRKEDEEGVLYKEMSYNTYRRVRRRYHTEVHGYDHALQFETGKGPRGKDRAYQPLPHTLASDMDFRKIGLPKGSWV